MFLIHPPVVKPTEPPPGIAKLSGALSAKGINHSIIDANLEGLYYLLRDNADPSIRSNISDKRYVALDTWTKRAMHKLTTNLMCIKDWGAYTNIDRYKRVIADLNRAISKSVDTKNIRLSLADYVHMQLSPLKSHDLLRAASHPEENPFYRYFRERITEAVEASRETHDILFGFSLNYLSQALTTFAMIGFVKRTFPKSRVVVGGGLVTSWMQNPSWQNHFSGLINYAIAGQGETQLLSLLGVKEHKTEHYVPRYNDFPVAGYLSPGFILPYSTSVGCYWGQCSFCPEKAEGRLYNQVDPNLVCHDLKILSKELRPTLIHLVDSAISPQMFKKIIEEPPGAKWYGFARFTPHLKDGEFCKALKASGCVMLKLGLESGDQGVIDYMNKGISLDIASQALKTLKDAGIATYVYLLFGTPKETINEARHTLEFTVMHSEYIDFLNLAIFNLPINSPETRGLLTEEFYEGDLSLYTDFTHPEAWGRRQVRQFLEGEFKKHPAIRSILKRHPPLFTSNHAPLFTISKNENQ